MQEGLPIIKTKLYLNIQFTGKILTDIPLSATHPLRIKHKYLQVRQYRKVIAYHVKLFTSSSENYPLLKFTIR